MLNFFDRAIQFKLTSVSGVVRRRGRREAAPVANDESTRRLSDTADTLRGRQSQVLPRALVSNLELLNFLHISVTYKQAVLEHL